MGFSPEAMDRDERKEIERVTDDAPFEVPAFDDKDFIRKELISFKTTLILFVLAIVAAAVTHFVWTSTHLQFFALALLGLALGLGPLPFLFRAAKIDISHWKRREWLGTSFLYLFFWLGFTLLLVNPPFTDAAAPRIETASSPRFQAPGHPIEFGAYVADNEGLRLETLTFCIQPFTGATPPDYASLSAADRAACKRDFERPGTAFWRHNESFPAGRYAFYVSVDDQEGHHATQTTWVESGSPFASRPSLPRDAKFVTPDDRLSVQLRDEIHERDVEFSIDGGASWHPMRVHPDAEKAKANWWTTDPSYEGWSPGPHNVSLRVVEQPTFLRRDAYVVKGIANDPVPGYNVTVGPELSGVGATKSPTYREFGFAGAGRTPGLGVPALLLGVLALVLVGRRRRDA